MILRSDRLENYYPQEVQERIKRVQSTIKELSWLIDGDTKLSYCLFGAIGYKTGSLSEFSKSKQHDNWDPSRYYLFGIAKLFSAELIKNNFQLKKRKNFETWEVVWRNSFKELQRLREEEKYYYDVYIFLNDPLVDAPEDIEIVKLSLNDEPIEVLLGYSTDELLLPLVGYEKHSAVERINTVSKYRASVPVETSKEEYLVQYHYASVIAQLLLDSLRLCRPLEDIGVLAIEALPCSFSAPRIRKTWANQFHDELARFEPKRFDFSPPSPYPLSELDMEKIKGTLLEMLPLGELEWNFTHAIRRFRNSIEKYSVDDPERLLEYAMALESLYLNDNKNERGELACRLSLRAARFLEKDPSKRTETFSVVKQLYSFRSQIAHGEDISRIKKTKDKEAL